MIKCGTCRYWCKTEVYNIKTREFELEDNPVSASGYGQCGRININGRYRDELAIAQDASDYWAALLSKDDFACSLWESQDEV